MNPRRREAWVAAVGSSALLGVNELEELAEACEQCVQQDIESRTGLKDVWNAISVEIKSEIIEKWTLMFGVVIASALRSAANHKSTNLSAGHKTKSENHEPAQ